MRTITDKMDRAPNPRRERTGNGIPRDPTQWELRRARLQGHVDRIRARIGEGRAIVTGEPGRMYVFEELSR